jgi:hypothetical protein
MGRFIRVAARAQSGRRWPRAATGTGHHPGRRQESASRNGRRGITPNTLPYGPCLAARQISPCHWEPIATPARDLPEADGQSSEHQTYPNHPKKHHWQPTIYLVWCNFPLVGVGYRSASGNTPTCSVREAADLVLKNYSGNLRARTIHHFPGPLPLGLGSRSSHNDHTCGRDHMKLIMRQRRGVGQLKRQFPFFRLRLSTGYLLRAYPKTGTGLLNIWGFGCPVPVFG